MRDDAPGAGGAVAVAVGVGVGVDCGLAVPDGVGDAEVPPEPIATGTGPVVLLRTSPTAAQAVPAAATVRTDQATTPAPVRHQADWSFTSSLSHAT